MKILKYLSAMYLGAGLFGGLVMATAVPLNWFGVLMYGLTWPAFLYYTPASRDCNVLMMFPDWFNAWMFTF